MNIVRVDNVFLSLALEMDTNTSSSSILEPGRRYFEAGVSVFNSD